MGKIHLCLIICGIIWIANIPCIIDAIRKNILCELYMHTGLGIFFCIPAVELTVGLSGAWVHPGYTPAEITGWILYIPSTLFVTLSIIELTRKGKSGSADFTDTKIIIKSGIYKIVRQPMTLGLAIWSIALILVFQSLFTILSGLISIFCFSMAAVKESQYNIKKFGNDYGEYMKIVPMWNFFKGIKNIRNTII